MVTDPIAEFLTRVRNASHARRKELTVRYSKLVRAIADVMSAKRFIDSVDDVTFGKTPELKITLRTDRGPVELKRISKPGQRIYVASQDIRKVRNGMGIAVISTSHGVMTGEEAKQKKLGGEYICEIY